MRTNASAACRTRFEHAGPLGRAPFTVRLGVEPTHERDADIGWQTAAKLDHAERVLPVHELPRRPLLRVQLLGIDAGEASLARRVLECAQARRTCEPQQLRFELRYGSKARISERDVTVDSVTVISETELEVAITVDSGAPSGPRTLVVWSDGTGPGPYAVTDGICGGCLSVT